MSGGLAVTKLEVEPCFFAIVGHDRGCPRGGCFCRFLVCLYDAHI